MTDTKQKGDTTIGFAISYFLQNGYEVCLPIGDKRTYDFIVEKDGHVERVQVKFAGIYKKKNTCIAALRITGGNQSYNYAKKYGANAFEYLFIQTERGKSYLIPWNEIQCRNELAIEHVKYQRYCVN